MSGMALIGIECYFDPTGTTAAGSSPTFDTSASSQWQGGNLGTSWTHTPTTTCSKILVGIFNHVTGGAVNVSSVTYGTTACTLQVARTSGDIRAELWGMVNPPTGAQTVSTVINAIAGDYYALSMSFRGGVTTQIFSATTTNVSTDGAPNLVIPSSASELVVDFAGTNADAGGSASTGANQTLIINATSAAGRLVIASRENGAASVTMSWSNLLVNWVDVAGSIT